MKICMTANRAGVRLLPGLCITNESWILETGDGPRFYYNLHAMSVDDAERACAALGEIEKRYGAAGAAVAWFAPARITYELVLDSTTRSAGCEPSGEPVASAECGGTVLTAYEHDEGLCACANNTCVLIRDRVALVHAYSVARVF